MHIFLGGRGASFFEPREKSALGCSFPLPVVSIFKAEFSAFSKKFEKLSAPPLGYSPPDKSTIQDCDACRYKLAVSRCLSSSLRS
jgi:hypothetical protein